MCNPFKAIKKVFKKVVKAASIIIPVVLGAAAIYFTVGAALGVTGTAGGWLSSTLGLSGQIGSVISGAVTQAGYGALLGGAAAAFTGGDIGQGLLAGAGIGAVTGGLTGAFSVPGTVAGPGSGAVTGPGSGAVAGGAPAGVFSPGSGVGGNIGAPAPAATPPPGGIGNFITQNQTLLGGAIQGLGSGIGGLAEADATVEAAKVLADRGREDQERIAGNFQLSGRGLLGGVTPDGTQRPTPAQQFNPANRIAQERGAMWRYNPETQRLELS